MFVRKYGESISKFEEINMENDNVFSFRAFLEYIVNVAEINSFDYHWKTMDFEVTEGELFTRVDAPHFDVFRTHYAVLISIFFLAARVFLTKNLFFTSF